MKIKNLKVRRTLALLGACFMFAVTTSPLSVNAEDEVLFEVTEENNDEVNEGGEVEYEEVEDTDTPNIVIELPSVEESTTTETPVSTEEVTTTPTETEETTTSPILDDTNYNPDTDYVEEIPEDIETEWDRKHPTPTPVVTPEPTPEVTPEPTPEVTPEPTPEVTPTPTPEVTPTPTPEVTPTPTPVVTPEPTPVVTPEPTKPTDEPETVPQTGIVDDLCKYFLVGGILATVYFALTHAGATLATAGTEIQEVKGARSTIYRKVKVKKNSKGLTK